MKIFDLHVDLSSYAVNNPDFNFYSESKIGNGLFPNQVDLQRINKGQVKFMLLNICPIVLSGKKFILPKDPLRETLRQLGYYINLINNDHDFKLITKDLNEDEKIKVGISIEGAYFIQKTNDLNLLPILKQMGIVSISPTWNISNSLGTGAADENSKKGLTKLGIKFIEKCEETGIIIDAVHSSRKTFEDIETYSKKPIFVSHTASQEVNKHRRNLTKKQIAKIVNKNGIIGLCFIQEFLGGNRIEDAVKNLNKMISIAGVDHISIGGDFDGMSWENLVTDLEDIGKMQKFISACLNAGIKESDLEKIAWKNAFNFFKSNI